MAETYDPCELDTAPLGGHDDLCEAEFIHGPMAWSPCRCAERAVADPRCPTCGPTTLEPHPRRAGVMRCTNCKEHLAVTDSTTGDELEELIAVIATDPAFRAAVDAGFAAGREAAAQAIRDKAFELGSLPTPSAAARRAAEIARGGR